MSTKRTRRPGPVAWLLAPLLVAVALVAGCGGEEDDESPSLAGTSWTLTSLDGADPIPEAVPTAEFDAEGGIAGSTGCNNYTGQGTVDGDTIEVGLLAQTQKACEEPIMAQEAAFTGLLQASTSFSIDGDTLELVAPDGTLTFQAA